MSQHVIKPRIADHNVVVGFDPHLQTFFARVTSSRTGGIIARLGTHEREIIDTIDLYKRVHRYGYLNAETKRALQAERDAGRTTS